MSVTTFCVIFINVECVPGPFTVLMLLDPGTDHDVGNGSLDISSNLSGFIRGLKKKY